MTSTDKINKLLNNNIFTKIELSEELCISRPTLDSRLKGVSKWKKIEDNLINRIFNEKFKN